MQTARKLKSLMGGAAVAALLILPSLATRADEMVVAANTRAPAAPAAPQAPPAPPANTAQWARWPVKSYDAGALKVDDLVGTLTVDVKDSGPMTVEVSGNPSRLNHLHVSSDGGTLHIDGEEAGDNDSVWDWKNWFNFSDGEYRRTTNLFVHVTIPRGAEVHIDDLVGNVTIGNTDGILHFGAAATTAHI
ncbi:MAG TPA: hypothetical protein VHU87_09585, partial [Rhizomicrobium sp.]|nr:hypothetical protein [Rhizomicrobium sp.]